MICKKCGSEVILKQDNVGKYYQCPKGCDFLGFYDKDDQHENYCSYCVHRYAYRADGVDRYRCWIGHILEDACREKSCDDFEEKV